MKLLIVEDEELAVRKLRGLLKEVDPEMEILADLDSIESTVDWLQHNRQPDIILMDIELVDGQSFEIFERTPIKCPVIFITSYDEYAIQAFTVNSVAYLLKPIEKEDLVAAFGKFNLLKEYYSTAAPGFSINNLVEELQARLQPKSYRKRFLTKYTNKLLTVETHEIAYFFIEARINFFRTYDNRKIAIDYTLEELEQMLDPQEFFRINRSYLISLKSIQKIDDYFGQRLILQLNPTVSEQVIISREKVSAFKTWMGK
ncbi:LytTR family DNA-binding domain-containing protein [Flavihumibacter rivuli]|uniref:LytR/AlgR family response regulator transcription factor n=1 Tax=Flavihumibacter rivuli TaxID=2838156 RepID=UPI001BDE762F|nr:LytTR family DNA-binding domain-containing protein [Flavihumibacter rivuli]ULQ58309.1 LytTR family DNA-binding domain-containing protein [Flavihumibacter rivuli]